VQILTKKICVFVLILNPTTKLPHILPSISASAHEENTPLILHLISLLTLNPVILLCDSAVSHKNKPDTNICNLCYSSSLPSNPKSSPYKSRRKHFSNPRLLPPVKMMLKSAMKQFVKIALEFLLCCHSATHISHSNRYVKRSLGVA